MLYNGDFLMVSMMRWLLALLSLCLMLATPALWAGEPPEEPILRLETGRHTATIMQVASDAKGRCLATASKDKTLRLCRWALACGHSGR